MTVLPSRLPSTRAKRRALPAVALLTIGCTLMPTFGFAAAASAPSASGQSSQIQMQYEQQRARCLNGTSNQDKTTCLKEAGAARDEAMKSRLDETGANYKADATARCNALTGDEARDCRSRIKGSGTTSSTGSVQSGGMFHETQTQLPRSGAASAASSAY